MYNVGTYNIIIPLVFYNLVLSSDCLPLSSTHTFLDTGDGEKKKKTGRVSKCGNDAAVLFWGNVGRAGAGGYISMDNLSALRSWTFQAN